MRRVLFQFTALADFFSEEFKSNYVRGLTYSVRENTGELDEEDELEKEVRERDAKLLKAAQAWIKEGKCMLGTPPAGAEFAKSKIVGKGKVG